MDMVEVEMIQRVFTGPKPSQINLNSLLNHCCTATTVAENNKKGIFAFSTQAESNFLCLCFPSQQIKSRVAALKPEIF